MEPSSGVGPEKRPTVDLVKDKNGTDQILLQNPKGASVKVIRFYSCFNLFLLCLRKSRMILRCKIQNFDSRILEIEDKMLTFKICPLTVGCFSSAKLFFGTRELELYPVFYTFYPKGLIFGGRIYVFGS